MATQLKKGSSGSEVSELQKLLNQNGFNLDVDGKFGAKTDAAVREYQQKNNLAVDGIVGTNTWGSLTKANTKTTNSPTTTNTAKTETPSFKYQDYQESDLVKQAEAALNNQLSQKPGSYQSNWNSSIQETLNKILNREQFSYDMNADALYQQYKDSYTQQGKMAMMDTMGQAAAMTGGYGSSYASIAGNQAYQQNLQQLNDVIPELHQLAYEKYKQEGQDLINQYSMLNDQEAQDYSKYRDAVSDYNVERDYLAGRYDTERSYDYGKYTDNKNFAYGQHRDDVSDTQWKNEFDMAKKQYEEQFAYQKDRDSVADSQWQKSYDLENSKFNFSKEQYEEAKKASSSGGGGGSGSSGGGNGSASLDHVSAMSSAAIVETMQGYQADKDNTGLSSFLDDCVASGRLTQAQADSYYAKYRTGTSSNENDTTVPPVSKKNPTSVEDILKFRNNTSTLYKFGLIK